MNIAMVTSYFQPEFGYEEYYISRKLSELGHEVSVITSDRIFPFKNIGNLLKEIGSEYTTRKRQVGVTKLDGFTVYRLPTLIEFLTDFNIILNLRETLKAIKPDIVHIQEPIQGGSALAAGHKDLGFKILAEQHAYATTFQETRSLKNTVAHIQYMFLRKPFGNYAYKRADAITAVNERAKQFMVKTQNIPEDKVEVVPLGTDLDMFKFNKTARKSIRGELGISNETSMILTAGRFDKAKKLEHLINAFNKVQSKLDTFLVLIGSGDDEYENSLKSLVKSLGLEKKVKFIKFVKKSKLPEYYSAAEIGFWNKASITILEAMSCRLPVILPEQPTIKFYITNDNGLFYPEDDVESLAKQLLTLASDPGLRVKMGKNAAELVKSEFSYDATTKKYLEIYERILKN
jgi:glycosyltransferase involved in cell wall biosynthesis